MLSISGEFQTEVGLHVSILIWPHTYIFWNVSQLVFKVSLAFNIPPLRNMKEWAKRLSSHKDTSVSLLLETTLGHTPAKRAALVLFGRTFCKRKAIELSYECQKSNQGWEQSKNNNAQVHLVCQLCPFLDQEDLQAVSHASISDEATLESSGTVFLNHSNFKTSGVDFNSQSALRLRNTVMEVIAGSKCSSASSNRHFCCANVSRLCHECNSRCWYLPLKAYMA